MRIKVLISFLLVLMAACSPAPSSPSEVYEEYYRRVIAGITYEKDKSYYTKNKQQEIEAKMPQYMKKMNKSRAEVIDFYLSFSQAVAKCKQISLVEEKIEGDNAYLLYEQTDICGNEATSPETQKVHMVNENGWKINAVEISI